MTTLKVDANETMELLWNGYDGAEDLFIRAFIHNESDTLVTSVNLVHTLNGAYRNSSVLFGGTFRYVIYKVFTDNTYTVLDENYAQKQDQFILRTGSDSLIRNDELILLFEDNLDETIELVFDEEYFEIEFAESNEDLVLEFDDSEFFNIDFSESNESLELVINDC